MKTAENSILNTAHLSLGSNLGDRERNLKRALEALERDGVRLTRRSAVYETEPQDVREQPWFLNLAVEVETALLPLQLLHAAQRIENELGRQRAAPKGPRVIDIDILLYGDIVMHTPQLELPHPRLTARRFVLEPLAEIAPGLRHPVLRRTMRDLLAEVTGQAARRADIEL